MRKLILFLLFIPIIFQVTAQSERYWVNGSGNWSDPMHWSLTSGGNPGALIPTASDDVFIDARSGLAGASQIAIDLPAEAKAFSVLTNVSIKGRNAIRVYGNIELAEEVKMESFKGEIELSTSSTATINIQAALNCDIIFDGKNAVWSLTNALSTQKNIYVRQGNFNTMEHAITCNVIDASSSKPKVFNWFGSELNVNKFILSSGNVYNFNAHNEIIDDLETFIYELESSEQSNRIVEITKTENSATCPINTYSGSGIPGDGTNYKDGSVRIQNDGNGTFTSLELFYVDGSIQSVATSSGNDVTFSNLRSGFYFVTIIKASGEEKSFPINIGPEDLEANVDVRHDPLCYEGDIVLEASPSGGTAGYTYSWSSFPAGQTNSTEDTTDWVGEGYVYSCVVTDANSCQIEGSYDYSTERPGPAELSIDNGSTSSTETCEGDNTGTLTVGTVSGGTPDVGDYAPDGYGYAIRKSGSAAALVYQGSNTFSNLTSGDYEVWVIDGNDCEHEHSSTVEVDSIPSPVPNAGANDEVCDGENYTMPANHASATSYTTVIWSIINNEGAFVSGQNTLEPVVTPNDINADGYIDLVLSADNDNCDPVTDTMRVTINPIPTPNAGADDFSCNYDYNLAGTLSLGGSFSWNQISGPSTNYTSDNLSQTITASAAGVCEFVLQETASGCSNTDTVEITFYDEPSVSFNPNDTSICEGQNYQVLNGQVVLVNASTDPANYTWTENGQGNLSFTNTLEPLYTTNPGGDNATVTLNLQIQGDGVCAAFTDNADFTINFDGLPVPNINGDNDVCVNETVSYTTDAGKDSYDWTISVGDGNIVDGGDGENFIEIQWPSDGNHSVAVSYREGADGCDGSNSLAVVVNPNPTPAVNPNAVETCAGTDIALNGETGGVGTGPFTHAWSPGTNLDDPSLQDPTFNSATPGVYNFTYTITDANTCSGTATVAVTNTEGPSVSFNPSDTAICEGENYTVTNSQVVLTNASTVAGTYTWSETGDGNLINTNTLEPTYNTNPAGDDPVVFINLRVQGTGVCAATQVDGQLKLFYNSLPTPTIVGDSSVCVGETITYTTESGKDNYNWNITVGDGNIVSGGDGFNFIEILWPSDGNHNVSVSYSEGADGCEGPGSHAIVVNPNPTPAVNPNAVETCVGIAANLNGETGVIGTAPFSHAWTPATNLDDASNQVPSFESNTAGIYNYTYTVTDAKQCSGTATVTVTNTEGPEISFNPNDTAVCEGDNYVVAANQVVLTNASTVEGTYTWSETGDGNLINTNTLEPTYITDPAGDDPVVFLNLRVQGNGVCAAKQVDGQLTLFYNSLPTPTINGNNDVCVGEAITYTTESGKNNYDWTLTVGDENIVSGGDGNDFIIVQWPNAGNNTVSVSYSEGASGCDGPGSLAVVVNENPTAAITPASVDTCAGNPITLNGSATNGTGPYDFDWSPVANLDDPTSATPSFLSAIANTYNFTLTVTDDNGCTSSASVIVDNTQGPTIDTITTEYTTCYDSETLDLSSFITSVSGTYTSATWSLIDGAGILHDPSDPLNAYYTIDDADRGDTVEFQMVVNSDDCGPVSETFYLYFEEQFVASIGGLKPFDIDPATSEMDVTISLNHTVSATLGFYLVNPDETKWIQLYDYSKSGSCGIPTVLELDSVTFTSNAAYPKMDFCTDGLQVYSKDTFLIEGDLADLANENPAEGGWRVVITDNVSGIGSGSLTYAKILFKDTDVPEVVQFESGIIDEAIVDKPADASFGTTTYKVPFGLWNTCNGDAAKAVVTLLNGNPDFTYAWSAGVVGTDTVDLQPNLWHYVTVTDAKGCTSIDSVFVNDRDPITLTTSVTNHVQCFSDSTGIAKVTAGGDGIGGYTYRWTNAANEVLSTSSTANNLPAGTYTILVTNSNNCTASQNVVINQPTAALSYSAAVTPTDCDVPNGIITLTPAGGGSPYSYAWEHDAGLTAATVENLAAGDYEFTITDDSLCTLVDTLEVIQRIGTTITSFEIIDSVTCFNDCDGIIKVNHVSDNGPYTYIWDTDPLRVSDTLQNVCGDQSYTVRITDNNNCFIDSTFTVPNPTQLTIDNPTLVSNVSCNGLSDGVAKVSASGGTGTLSYTWYVVVASGDSIVATGDSVNTLPAAEVFVRVEDFHSCTATSSITITEPDALIIADSGTELPSGCTVADGKAWVDADGGTELYTYLWDVNAGSQTNDTAINLSAGTYTVTITDDNLCTIETSITINSDSDLTAVISEQSNVDCFGNSTGSATITPSNGTSPYQYDYADVITDDSVFTGLSAGNHIVTVIDAVGCTFDVSIDITEPAQLTANINVNNAPLCNASSDGSITASGAGGTGDYSYSWSDGQDVATAIDLVAGTYTVTLTDENLCTATAQVTLTDPDLITFDIDIANTTCGQAEGVAEVVNIRGGTGDPANYSIRWEDADGNQIGIGAQISNLEAGSYTAYVSDDNACEVSATAIIEESNSDLNLSVVTSDVTCNGTNTGQAIARATGGDGNYTFTWSTGHIGETLENVPAGNYSVEVEEGGGCKAIATATINEPDTLQNTITITDSIQCFDDVFASFKATATGGTNSYTYIWTKDSPSGEVVSNSDEVIDVSAGKYFVQIEDGNACLFLDSIDIIQPGPITFNYRNQNTECNNPTGFALVENIAGGVSPYEYHWYVKALPNIVIPGSNTDSIGSLWADVYVIEITDALGCTVSQEITIEDNGNVSFTYEILNHVYCTSSCDAAASITGVFEGGAPLDNYTVNWSHSGANTESVNDLCMGPVRVTVENPDNGCKAVEVISITDEDALKFDSISVVNDYSGASEACNGSIDLHVSGGIIGPGDEYIYAYFLDGNSIEPPYTALCEGDYSVQVIDVMSNINCSITENITIERDTLTVDTIVNHVLCYGDATGSIELVARGGGATDGYTYAWGAPIAHETGALVENLAAGTYSYTVSASSGKSIRGTVDVNQNSEITFTYDIDSTGCGAGSAEGEISITGISGGSGSYQTPVWSNLNWPGIQTGRTISGLEVGIYDLYIEDSYGCFVTESIIMPDTSDVEITVDNIIDVLCHGSATGSIEVSTTGATGNLFYTWNGTPGTDVLENAYAGSYEIKVTDDNLCSDITAAVIEEPDTLNNEFIYTQPMVCAGNDTVSFYAAVSGGTKPYTYTWEDAAGNPVEEAVDSSLVDVTAGHYFVTITDALGCIYQDDIEIIEPASISLFIESDSTTCGNATGWAQVTATGGASPYSYNWSLLSDPSVILDQYNTDSVIHLAADAYLIEVTDFLGCSAFDTVFIYDDGGLDFNAVIDHHVLCENDGTAYIENVTMLDSLPDEIVNYTTLWNGSFIGNTNSNLSVGTHIILVEHDVSGCRKVDSLSINNNDVLDYTLSWTDNWVQNDDVGVGSATITPTGGDQTNPSGEGLYWVDWYEEDQTTAIGTTDTIYALGNSSTIADLTEGWYYVSLKNNRADGNNCEQWDSIYITRDTLSYIVVQQQPVSCYGGADGILEVQAIGGSQSGYEYRWDNSNWDDFEYTAEITGLEAGDYYLTISDDRGSETTATLSIDEATPIAFDFEITPTNCGHSIGTAKVINIMGDNPPFSVTWSHPSWAQDSVNQDSITNLWVTTFGVTVTDAMSCAVDTFVSIPDTSDLQIIIDDIIDVACYGGNSGMIAASAENGTEPYDYTWTDGTENDTLFNASSGYYGLHVVDDKSCARDTMLQILDSPELNNRFIIENAISCSSDSLATFSANVSGGVEPYTFAWADTSGNSYSGATLTDVEANWYYLTITDANDCEYYDSIHIFKPDPILLSITTEASACGDSTGSATVNVTGGIAPYSYNWYLASDPFVLLDGYNTPTASNLWVDVYIVEVTDSLGCVQTQSIELLDDGNVGFAYTVQKHVTCIDTCNAIVSIDNVFSDAGPTSNFTVAWDNGETGELVDNLCIGYTYVTVTTTDDGCQATKAIEITDEDALKVGRFDPYGNIGGPDNCNGSAKVIAGGGNAPEDELNKYDYLWSTGATSDRISDLCAGWYYVTVFDNYDDNGCTVEDSIEITNDTLRVIKHVNNILCYGESTGSVTLEVYGGWDTDYVYEWSHTDLDSATVEDLAEGIYSFTVTSPYPGFELVLEDTVYVGQTDDLSVYIAIMDSTRCNEETGSIYLEPNSIQGGTAPFEYAWRNENWLADSTGTSIYNLGIGTYYLEVTDSNNCEYPFNIEMVDTAKLSLELLVTNDRCYQTGQGRISANVEDDSGNVVYSWSTGEDGETITGLDADWYALTITDNNECQRFAADSVREPDAITFDVIDTVFNDCYQDCNAGFTISNVKGGNYNVTYDYKVIADETIEQDGNPVFENLCTNSYTIEVVDTLSCVGLVDIDLFARSPEVVARFNLVNVPSCNMNSTDGVLEIEVDPATSPVDGATIDYSFIWNNNPFSNNAILNGAQPGTNTVKVSDQFNCVVELDTLITALTEIIPFAWITNGSIYDNYFCPADTAELNADANVISELNTRIDSIVWSNINFIIGDSIGGSVKSFADSTQAFTAKIWANGCYADSTLTVHRYLMDTLMINIEDDLTEIVAGQELHLSMNTIEVTFDNDSVPENLTHSYTWTANNDGVTWNPSPPDSIANIAIPSMLTLFTGYDTLSILYEDELQQCVLTDTFSIMVLPDFVPPSGFSPNEDGINDYWELPVTSNYAIEVQIYNRWGGLVWQSKDYYSAPWEGKNIKGKDLPSGTYYYAITREIPGGLEETTTGPITILR